MMSKHNRKEIKEGDRVRWQDVLSGMIKTGKVIELTTVVAETRLFNPKDPYDRPEFTDTNKRSYTVKCDQNRRQYCFTEGEIDLEILKPN